MRASVRACVCIHSHAPSWIRSFLDTFNTSCRDDKRVRNSQESEAVSPEDSDEDEVTSSSWALAAEGAQREVSSVLLGLRQFTPQEVAVEGASAIRLLHRVHVNLQQFDNLSVYVTCHDTGYNATKTCQDTGYIATISQHY